MQGSGILFVGTGSSSGTPQLSHVLAAHSWVPQMGEKQWSPKKEAVAVGERPRSCSSFWQKPCKVCLDAFSNSGGYNRRNNVSIAIKFGNDDSSKTVLVDCGKTFRDAALRTLTQNGIVLIDAVFLTHDHQDAIAGLDDIRDLQQFYRVPGKAGKSWYEAVKVLPIHTGTSTVKSLSKKFDYFATSCDPMPTKIPVVSIRPIDETGPKEFEVGEAKLTALPIEHGCGYTCLGLSFGPKDAAVLYLSDVSAIPDNVEAYAQSLGSIKLLIIDAINYNRPHSSHFCLKESLLVVEVCVLLVFQSKLLLATQRWQPETA
eukprot:Selendium_serpulae@DN5802_c0_g1_i1.p1